MVTRCSEMGLGSFGSTGGCEWKAGFWTERGHLLCLGIWVSPFKAMFLWLIIGTEVPLSTPLIAWRLE
ncbi:hypothetical protein SBA4_280008 [Candidatus Sulfopaludibacter sp. SbA4]|nr:hypothetical protein SBA4_280008 [Candidatus Sulfopaludibacter sp. SbA4]